MCHRGVAILMLIGDRAVRAQLRRDRSLGGVALTGVFEAARNRDEDAVRRRRVAETAQSLHLGLEHVARLHPALTRREVELPLEGDVENLLDIRTYDANDVHQRVALPFRKSTNERLALLGCPALVDQ